ncbi:MAG TPA: DNA-formamidopyrimidine glycosylase family protein, partial [Chryseolinea sp.]|nr:DNA-formamidopyrimidine glycosylase family protein [Chryseolinea sp.]
MPEGPSIVLAKEAIQSFVGKKILTADGSSKKVDFGRLLGTKMSAVKTWGKHLLLCFPGFTLRVHFLMFGSYAINEAKVHRIPRLKLSFSGKKTLYLYTCSVIAIDGSLSKIYDWTADVMNKKWDNRKAMNKLKNNSESMVCDVLLDQNIFAGVGNIIKNEVLFRIKTHPASKVGELPSAKKRELIREVVHYSQQFLAWKRTFTLRKHWLAYTKKVCPRDEHPFLKKYL